MALSCIILEIKRNIGQKSWFFSYPLVFDAPVRSPSDYCILVWFEKTRMMVYPTVTKVWRYVYPFWQNVRTWQTDRQTDRQTDTAWRQRPRLMQASRGKNGGDLEWIWVWPHVGSGAKSQPPNYYDGYNACQIAPNDEAKLTERRPKLDLRMKTVTVKRVKSWRHAPTLACR